MDLPPEAFPIKVEGQVLLDGDNGRLFIHERGTRATVYLDDLFPQGETVRLELIVLSRG